MTADGFVARWLRPARLRSGVNDVLIGTPFAIGVAAVAWRGSGVALAIAMLVAVLTIAVGFATWRSRRFDRIWLVRQLDAARPELEDSADLLVADDTGLGPLQRLQRRRIEARLAAVEAATLRPGWQSHAIAAAWIAGLAITIAALAWPGSDGTAPLRATPAAATAGPPHVIAQRLRISPPAYTGLAARDTGLSARAPQGSRLRWTLRFAPDADSVVVQSADGRRIPFTRSGQGWIADASLDRSLLYRIVAPGAVPGPLHRIDAIADTPPTVRVVDPERTLTPMAVGQTHWRLVFDVTDDHGIAAAARLRLIVTQGQGENISFRETARVIAGQGNRRSRRFETVLDIRSLGLTAGNDLVAQLIVADNRLPEPQTSRSSSLILRWPADLGRETAGLDGMVKTVLPAYFRSQRQIIIDTEALIKQRRRLSPERFLVQSDTIGVDQRTLRLRYGGMLGDETSEAPVLPTSDAPETPAAQPKQPLLPAGHGADDGHDHGSPKPLFGSADDILADYGHAHGEADGATLLDPASSALLRQAVDAMWQSELNLRQGAPEKALPFAYVALRRIKEVQQASRIYLSRTGPELPPIDLTRRLSGDRKGLGTPSLVPEKRASDGANAVPAAAWRALAGPDRVALDAVQAWAAANPPADPLALAAAIDAVTRDPDCVACRAKLRAQLWASMGLPPAQVTRRSAGDAIGRRYQDALP